MAKLKVTQVRSLIRESEPHKRVVKALGLRKLNQSVVHYDTPEIRGMIRKVAHLVTVEEQE